MVVKLANPCTAKVFSGQGQCKVLTYQFIFCLNICPPPGFCYKLWMLTFSLKWEGRSSQPIKGVRTQVALRKPSEWQDPTPHRVPTRTLNISGVHLYANTTPDATVIAPTRPQYLPPGFPPHESRDSSPLWLRMLTNTITPSGDPDNTHK